MNVVLATIKAISYVWVNPVLLLLLLVISVVFYIKNKKINFIQTMVLGEKINSPLELTISQIVIGIIAGSIASLILTTFGVSFEENSGIAILFLISIVVIIYKPKIFSFPYVATVLSLISLICSRFNVGRVIKMKLNIPNIIILISIISIVQGILIMIDGRKGYIPVFTNKNDKILGGFIFKRCWSLPIAFFIIFNSINDFTLQNIDFSNIYSSIIGRDLIPITTMTALAILPFYAVIGYEAVTFTKNKVQKTLISGGIMVVYGGILFLISFFSRYNVMFEVLSVILMSIIYIIIKYIEKHIEKNSKPLFVSDEEGICILDVVPKSRAFREGVRSGDKIIELNGLKPFSEKEILKSIRDNYINTTLKIKNIKGEVKEYIISSKSKSMRFGVILVPVNIRKKYNIDKLLQLSELKKNV